MPLPDRSHRRPPLPEWPALVAIALWGSVAAVTGGALGSVGVAALLAVSLGTAAVALAAAELLRGRRFSAVLRPPLGDVLVGAVGLGGYHALLFAAFACAPLVEANLLNYAWPLLTVLLATPIARERFEARSLVAALLGLAGATFVVGAGSAAPSRSAMSGYALALGAAFTWAVFSNVLKKRPIRSESLPLACAIPALIAFVVCLVDDVPLPRGGALAASLYLGALPIGLATWLWERGISRGRVVVVGTLAYLTPLLSTLGVWLVLGRPLTTGTAIGGVLIVAAAVLGAARRSEPPVAIPAAD